ncbi:histone acetyltransferase MCC1-like [Durio zibethinus]|uniref:N-alpha-acetyltransferase 60 n=1 Tax=Durio zibethinus TaxID=66656 RepID=A0A6P5YUE7_DURZI|nr:histone acetyltransferase MCC1-like [Durio zibethinus]
MLVSGDKLFLSHLNISTNTYLADLLRYDSSKVDQTLVYIPTLGVVDAYRNLGIATALIHEVMKYALSIPVCHAVYLHVISYNNPAIHLYKKMSFKCVRRVHGFYSINCQHYDSYLFVYHVNGSRSCCSSLELVTTVISCMKTCLKFVAAKLMKNEEKMVKWPKFKETWGLVSTQNNRVIKTGCLGCKYV